MNLFFAILLSVFTSDMTDDGTIKQLALTLKLPSSPVQEIVDAGGTIRVRKNRGESMTDVLISMNGSAFTNDLMNAANKIPDLFYLDLRRSKFDMLELKKFDKLYRAAGKFSGTMVAASNFDKEELNGLSADEFILLFQKKTATVVKHNLTPSQLAEPLRNQEIGSASDHIKSLAGQFGLTMFFRPYSIELMPQPQRQSIKDSKVGSNRNLGFTRGPYRGPYMKRAPLHVDEESKTSSATPVQSPTQQRESWVVCISKDSGSFFFGVNKTKGPEALNGN